MEPTIWTVSAWSHNVLFLPGHSYVYNFTITQNGTYWYHFHVAGQYPDGNRGPLIVHNKDAYFNSLYQEEMVITMTDWYNTVMKILDKEFLSPYDPEGNEPIPDSMLVNETMASKWSVEPNTTYLVRLINIGSFVSHYFYIEGHNFTIVEVDGVYTEPATTDMLYIAVGQRYSVLLTTKDSTNENYAVVNIFDSTQLAIILSTLALNQTNWLEYNPSAPFPMQPLRLTPVVTWWRLMTSPWYLMTTTRCWSQPRTLQSTHSRSLRKTVSTKSSSTTFPTRPRWFQQCTRSCRPATWPQTGPSTACIPTRWFWRRTMLSNLS